MSRTHERLTLTHVHSSAPSQVIAVSESVEQDFVTPEVEPVRVELVAAAYCSRLLVPQAVELGTH